MKRQRSIAMILFGLLLIVHSVAMAQSEPALSALRGSVHPASLRAQDNGILDSATQLNDIHIYITPSAAKKHALTQLLSDQRTPGTANYHKWLTPAQFGARFGASAQDEKTLRSWLAAQGFKNITLSPSRSIIRFSGSAATAGNAFHATIHALAVDGEKHYGNTTEISLPSNVAGLVSGIRGLDDFKPKPLLKRLSPQLTQGNGVYNLAPGDIATIYDLQTLYAAGIDGTGVTVAVVGQTDVPMDDITAYRAGFNLPVNPPTVMLDPASSDPGTSSVNLFEADLDIELLGAVAPNAKLVYVNSSNVNTSLEYAINQNLAQVVSMSYGGCEADTGVDTDTYRYLYQQANAQGMTIVVASGDQGVANCDFASAAAAIDGISVDSPASIPEFTAVGGTSFITPGPLTSSLSIYFGGSNSASGGSAISYIPETSWNETASQNHLEASGGGASILYAKPGWQGGPGVPDDGARDVPDVALFAGNEGMGYIYCSSGDCASGSPNVYPWGGGGAGTSASTPVFAGIVALLNQYLVSKGEITAPGLGNINPHLYLMASNSSTAFHDITSGDNIVPCTTGTTDCTTGSFGDSAGPGYDLVTGLGSIDGYNMVSEWGNYSTIGTTLHLSSSATSIVSGQSVTFTATVTAASGNAIPSGKVTFYAEDLTEGSANGGKDLSIGTSTLDATGHATITTSTLSFGAAVSIMAEYEGTQEFGQSSDTSFVQPVLVPTTTTLTLPNQSWTWVQGEKTSLMVQVMPAAAFVSLSNVGAVTGPVTLYNGTTSLGTLTVTGSSGSFDTTALPAGNYSVTAVFNGNASFATSTSAVGTFTIASATPISTTTTLSSSTAQAVQGANVTLTATVAPVSGSSTSTAPTGTVTFFSGTTSLGTATPVSGIASLTTAALAVGTDALTATYSGDSIFAASQTSAAVSVVVTTALQPSFTLSASSSTLTVTGGQSASTTLTVTPANGFNQALSFACSGLPVGSTCTFGTPSVQPNGTSTVALSISTAALTAANHTEMKNAPLFALLPCLLLLSRKRRSMFLNLCNVVLLAVILTGTGLGLIGCGGSSAAVTPTQPTSKTSTVTVIATTATGLSQSNAITLIVN